MIPGVVGVNSAGWTNLLLDILIFITIHINLLTASVGQCIDGATYQLFFVDQFGDSRERGGTANVYYY